MERLRIAFLVCYGLATAFLLAATFSDGRAATAFGILAGAFVTAGFVFVAAWMVGRSGR